MLEVIGPFCYPNALCAHLQKNPAEEWCSGFLIWPRPG
jgi:hypothetical protein